MTEENPVTWTAPNCSTPKERAHAQELYESGLTIPEIARQISRANSTVYAWITGDSSHHGDNYKVKSWKGKAGPEEKAEAVQLFKAHRSISKVCELTDRSYDTVRRWLKQAGIDTSAKPKETTEVEALKAQLAELKAENQKLKDTIISLANKL